MQATVVKLDAEVLAEVHRRSTPGSYNHRLRQIFGMPPPPKRGWPKGKKRKKGK